MRGHAVTRGPILPPPPPIFPPNLHRSRKRTKKRRGGASDLFFFFFFIFCIEIRIRVSIISVFQFRDLCHERPDSLDIAISRNWREKYIFLMEKLGMETFATKRSKKLFCDPFSAWKRRRRIFVKGGLIKLSNGGNFSKSRNDYCISFLSFVSTTSIDPRSVLQR